MLLERFERRNDKAIRGIDRLARAREAPCRRCAFGGRALRRLHDADRGARHFFCGLRTVAPIRYEMRGLFPQDQYAMRTGEAACPAHLGGMRQVQGVRGQGAKQGAERSDAVHKKSLQRIR